jgi:predicted enzyme related to lactoylglutathione lyase
LPRVTHFEIQASEPQTLITFYQSLFAWKFQQWGTNAYWLIETGPGERPGINGGLLPRRGSAPAEGQPVNCFVCTVEVPSVDESLDRSSALGGSVAVAKMAIPGVGWLAYIKDPDGNIVGMTQPDTSAA